MTGSQMQSYQFEGRGIRFLLDDDGSVSIVATDLARTLEYPDATHMIRTLDPDERTLQKVEVSPNSNDFRRMTVVTEAGMYKLILQREAAYIKDPERRAAVERFQRWVTHEVLPSIRRHGAYMTPETMGKVISDPDFGIRLLTALKDEQEKRVKAEKQVKELEPDATYGRALSATDSDITVGDFAKILRSNGYETGQNLLFKQWVDEKVLFKVRTIDGRDEYRPMQRYIDCGWFRLAGHPFTNKTGSHTSHTVMVKPKGQKHYLHKYLANMPKLIEEDK